MEFGKVHKMLTVSIKVKYMTYVGSGRADSSPTKLNVMQRIALFIHCAELFPIIKLIMCLVFFLLFFYIESMGFFCTKT